MHMLVLPANIPFNVLLYMMMNSLLPEVVDMESLVYKEGKPYVMSTTCSTIAVLHKKLV